MNMNSFFYLRLESGEGVIRHMEEGRTGGLFHGSRTQNTEDHGSRIKKIYFRILFNDLF